MESLNRKLINEKYHPKFIKSKDDLSKYLVLSALEISKGEVTDIRIMPAIEAFQGEEIIPTDKTIIIGYKKYIKNERIHLSSLTTEVLDIKTKKTYMKRIRLLS